MRNLVERIKTFLSEVRQELAKCSRPNRDELLGSSGVILVSMLVLGVFSFVIDMCFHYMINWVVK